ncbi:MAG: MgtC/SapB family protein [Thermoanaerobaculia bacterium]
MEVSALFMQLGVSLGLGLLVGLQRESVASPLAGLRTFALITILGNVCAILATTYGGWVLGAGFLSLAAMVLIGNIAMIKLGTANPGLTTEVAVLVMFSVGAIVGAGDLTLGIVIGGGVAVLLQFKTRMRGVAAKLDEPDITAIMRFVLISLVILPLLPNRAYGPFDVLNPFEIWLMVVLIVGISLGGYILYRFVGRKTGVLLAGVLGGIISSTATTVSYAKRTRVAPETSRWAAVVIMIASSIVMIRILVEIALVGPRLLAVAAPPILILLAVAAALSMAMWRKGKGTREEMPRQENPTELRPALVFALIYAIVLVGVAAGKRYWGSKGLYVIAMISGLTDVDAITLSVSQLVAASRIELAQAWRVIVIAILSNLVFKAGVVLLLGRRRVFYWIATLFAIHILAGALILAFWPG